MCQNTPFFTDRGILCKRILASSYVAPATERGLRCTSRHRNVVVRSESATVLRAMRLQTAALHTSVVWQGRGRPAKRAAMPHRRNKNRGTRSPAATVRRAERFEKEIHGRGRVILRYRSRRGRHRSSRASRCHLCCVILFHFAYFVSLCVILFIFVSFGVMLRQFV